MDKNKKVKRATRIKPFSLDDLKFTLKNDVNNRAYKVIDLSTSGIGFARATGDIWPGHGEVVKGTLTIEDKPYELVLRIVRKDDEKIGSSFEDGATELARVIQTRFQPELTAQELTKVTTGILREQPDGEPHWYFDGAGGELYFVEKEGHINRYRINFATLSVEGVPGKAPVITEDVEDELLSRAADAKLKEKVLRFLTNVKGLEPEYFDKLSELITGF